MIFLKIIVIIIMIIVIIIIIIIIIIMIITELQKIVLLGTAGILRRSLSIE